MFSYEIISDQLSYSLMMIYVLEKPIHEQHLRDITPSRERLAKRSTSIGADFVIVFVRLRE